MKMLRIQNGFGTVLSTVAVMAALSGCMSGSSGGKAAAIGGDAGPKRKDQAEKFRDELSTGTIRIPISSSPAGTFAMLANPYSKGDNLASEVLGDVPIGTTIYQFVEGNYQIFIMDQFERKWLPKQPQLNPGEGFFIQFPAGTVSTDGFITLHLSGHVPTDDSEVSHVLPAPGKFAMLGSKRGLAAAQRLSADLGFEPEPGDTVYRYRNGQYEISTFDDFDLKWSPSEPQLELGEAFFLTRGGGKAGDLWSEKRGQRFELKLERALERVVLAEDFNPRMAFIFGAFSKLKVRNLTSEGVQVLHVAYGMKRVDIPDGTLLFNGIGSGLQKTLASLEKKSLADLMGEWAMNPGVFNGEGVYELFVCVDSVPRDGSSPALFADGQCVSQKMRVLFRNGSASDFAFYFDRELPSRFPAVYYPSDFMTYALNLIRFSEMRIINLSNKPMSGVHLDWVARPLSNPNGVPSLSSTYILNPLLKPLLPGESRTVLELLDPSQDFSLDTALRAGFGLYEFEVCLIQVDPEVPSRETLGQCDRQIIDFYEMKR